MKDYKKQIGKKIKSYRKKLSLTIENLSCRSKLSTSFVGEIERGKKICSINTLKKIADALNVTLADLFDFTKETQKDESLYIKEIIQLIKLLNKNDKEFTLSLISKIIKRLQQ